MYAVVCNGDFYEFTYEEMVELIKGAEQKISGNESFEDMKAKVKLIDDKSLPISDY